MSDLTPMRVVEAEWTPAAVDISPARVDLGESGLESPFFALAIAILLFVAGWSALAWIVIAVGILSGVGIRRRIVRMLQGRIAPSVEVNAVGLVKLELRNPYGVYASDFGSLTVTDEFVAFEGAHATFLLSPGRWTSEEGGYLKSILLKSVDFPDRSIVFARPLSWGSNHGRFATHRSILSAFESFNSARRATPDVSQIPPLVVSGPPRVWKPYLTTLVAVLHVAGVAIGWLRHDGMAVLMAPLALLWNRLAISDWRNAILAAKFGRPGEKR